MNKVYVIKTPNADTRSLKTLDYDLVLKDTKNHIYGVENVMNEFANTIKRRALNHDWTKLKYFDMFYKDISSGKTGEEFFKLDWWQIHKTERHHLNARVPKDVNLIDVIEMLCDCVAAGMARTGTVYPINLSNEILQNAVKNTVEMLKDNVIGVDL